MATSPLEVKQYVPHSDLEKIAGSSYQRRNLVPVSIQRSPSKKSGGPIAREVSRSWPTRNKYGDHPRKRYVNVQYLSNIKNFKDRIKSTSTCNQQKCKKMRERLDEHLQVHHSNRKVQELSDPDVLSDTSSTSRYQEISLSSLESSSMPYFTHKTKESLSVQTGMNPIDKPKLKDYSHGPIASREQLDSTNRINNSNRNEITLINTETREVLTPRQNFYKEYVRNETVKWMKKLPMNAEIDATKQILRDNIINLLVEDISQISKSINDENYEESLKSKIDKCLNEIPMWLPCVEAEQGPFKERLAIDLLNSINSLNNRLFREDKPSSSKNRSIHFHEMKDTIKDSNKYIGDIDIRIIQNEIREWLSNIKMEKDESGNDVTTDDVSHLLLNKLKYLLKEPKVAAQYKFKLKREILEILKKLPLRVKNPATKMVHFCRLAEELANRLLRVQARYVKLRFNKVQNIMFQEKVDAMMNMETPMELKNKLYTLIGDCIELYNINCSKEIIKEITEVVLYSLVSTNSKSAQNHVNDIIKIMQKYCNVSLSKVTEIANHIVIQAQNEIRDECSTNLCGKSISAPRLSGIISVYTSEELNTTPKYPITSSPKKAKIPIEEIPRQTPEEISLSTHIAEAIQQWMNDTIPIPLNTSGELSYREAIAYDLAGEIVETLRNAQLMPSKQDKYNVPFTISTWLVKFRIFDDFEKHLTQIQDLYERIFDLIKTVPILTRPQQGNRQAIGFAKFRADESQLLYAPEALDMLEDEISVWMNQQSPELYIDHDRSVRGRLIHELAEKVQDDLVNKRPEMDIQNDVRQWLNMVIRPDAKAYIPEMTEELRDRLKRLPQEATLHKEHIDKMLYVLHHELTKGKVFNIPEDDIIDNTMKEFIQKFLEGYCDTEDQFARRVISKMLQIELMKLKPPTRKEVYKKFINSESNALSAPDQFVQELEYINLLSDWLNLIPVDPNYKALGNKHRVNFIQHVAKYITAIENERSRAPSAMDYDLHLANIIMSYLTTLPIPNEQKANMAKMIDQLLLKLATYRESIRHKANKAPIIHDLGEFIDEYVRKYGADIGDNEIKLEIWSDRLMNEIQKIVYETSNSAELTQTRIYNRLANVSIPLDDAVDTFVLEINYIKEIVEWMKNLPLSPITTKEDQDYRVAMVSDLAEKLFERKITKTAGIKDPDADSDLVQFIAYWISQLPLERREEIIVPVVIKQLINRVDRASEPKQSWDITTSNVTRITDKSHPGVIKPEPRPKTPALKSKEYKNNPEALIVDCVEKFCNALPIRDDNQDVVNSTKNEIMMKVLQKTGELNVDPVIFNDAPLYRDIFTNEVNEIIEQAPLNQDTVKNVENLKEELVQTIIDANAAIKDKSAGEEYKQDLDNVINVSIPNQQQQMYEPGFEMYKNRLVNMFILENFDRSNEELKLKYEKQIKSEIDRYFECAQNIIAMPLTRDQIYNQLYSVLFKVPIPNEIAVANEVEIVKTRCEIDKWFEKLPLREAYNLNEQLEWDQMLAALAKRIHEIETKEQNPQDKILKEIKRWLPRLPILPGKEGRFDEFARNLQDALKMSATSRKCATSKLPKGGKVKVKKSKEQMKQATETAATPKPSNNKIPTTSNIPCCQTVKEPQENPVDLMLKAVLEWCSQLPLLGSTVEELESHKQVKEQIFRQIIIKLAELNGDPEIFANEFMYNEMLDEELENILSLIPTSYDIEQSKEARKLQLMQQIAAINMLIKKEKDRQRYKDNLKNTVVSVLEPPTNMTSDKIEMFDKLVEEIVEDFVQLHYNKNDEEGRQYYKSKVQEAVVNKFYEIQDQPETEPPVNPLIKINQLLCELAKIPLPDKDILKDEVEEIKMKEQVDDFFDQLHYPNKDEINVKSRNEIKLSLAKLLAHIEKSGHNCSSENKMRSEIAKHLKKVEVEVLPQVIDKFVEQLKNNESERKAAPPEDLLISEIRQDFDAIQIRPFGSIPPGYISGIDDDDNVFLGGGINPAGPPPPARLALPGTGPRPLSAGGEPVAPPSRTRVTFTPQPTTRAGSRSAPPSAVVPTPELTDEEDERCKCGGRRMKFGGRRPTCILRRSSDDGREYCVPMPRMCRRMPFPGFVYF